MNQNADPVPAPKGYRHPKCYARDLGDCATKISKEHFISENLLRRIQLNNTAKIAGLAWQKPETFNIVPLKGLASGVLCKHHNSALSRLDHTIGGITETITRFDRGPSIGIESARVNGSDLERWMLKCLLGMTASGNSKATMKPECVGILFKKNPWPVGWGLYFSDTASNTIYHTDSLMIETMIHPERPLVLAGQFHIQGLPFTLVLGKPGDARSFGVWRPREIRFKSAASEKILELCWDGGQCGEPVTLTRVETYDGPPPIWREWEKNG